MQLTKSMEKWASIYTADCEETARQESFSSKIARQMEGIRDKLRRKFSNKSSNVCDKRTYRMSKTPA